jgi:hypothetical protein
MIVGYGLLISVEPVMTQRKGDPDDPRPTPPERPLPDDCCQSGCNPCVFDLYEEALERYEARLAEWNARHAKRRRG